MEAEGLLITGVLDLAQLPDHARHLITLVLEIDIAQGPILLLQDDKAITLFPLGGKLSTPDHQEVLPGRRMVIKSVGLILLLMAMVSNRIKAMDMLRNLCTSLRLMLIVASGSHRDHPLDLDQDLLNCHQGVEDEVAGSWQCAAGASVHFLQLIATFAKSCILLEVCEYDG